MGKKKSQTGGFWIVFSHADVVDMLLMAVGFVGSVGDGLASPTMLVVMSRLMNNVGSIISGDTHDPGLLVHKLNKNAFVMCNVAVGAWIFCFLEGYCWTRTAERQAARMRVQYMKAVLRQDVSYFDTSLINASEVITCVSNDTLIVQDCISEKVPNFLMNTATFIGCYIAGFVLLWRLAIMAFPFILLLVVPGIVYGRVLISIARKMKDEYDKAGIIAQRAISSIRTVYAFVGETRTVSAFSEALQGSVKLGLNQGLAKGFAMGSNGLTFAIWSFTTWYASRLVMYHGAKGGTTFAVGASINVGGLSVGSSLSNLKYFSEAHEAAKRIAELISRVPDIDSDNADGKVLENIAGEVEFKHVNFAYPSRPETLILRDFSLKAPAGKMVALVGGSGSGKSTVISLLQRFYNPLRGEILLDGMAIDKLQLKWLRSQMGLVSQEPTLFSTTVKENILFGKEDASMEEVIEAAKASNAHSFIAQLPYSYDTQVGERGMQLSGGQKQRIAIARAIVRKPRILLLDEATSALDTESERTVQEAIDHVSVGTTTIVIAHRLSTIRHAHIVAVVEAGEVTESGSHDHLIRLPQGRYASLLQQQNQASKTKQNNQFQDHHQHNTQLTFRDHSSLSISHESSDPEVLHRKNRTRKPSFRRLVALNQPEWKIGLLGCLGAVLFGAVQPTYSFIMGSMISVFFHPSHDEVKRQTRIFAPCFAALAVLAFATNAVQHCSFAYIGEKLTMRVREKMLAKILSFEIGWFDRYENSTGAICSRLANDANSVRCMVGDRTSVIVQAASTVLISAITGLTISWRLAIVMISVQPLIIACFYTRRVLLRQMFKMALKSQEKSSNLASEAVSNIRTITSFSSQSHILKMLEQAQASSRQENIRQSWYAGAGLATSQSLTMLFTALNYWYGGKLLVQRHMSAKQLFQTIMILERTGRVLGDVGSMATDLAKGTDAIQSVFTVLDRTTQIEPDNPRGRNPDQITGHIEIQDVDFAYPSRPSVMIFEGFSLDIQAGKSTALVGQSGSGKSTIVGLIERFYDPLRGSVKVDGRDIREYRLRSLRKHMALVSQEPALFAGTIRENILYGSRDDIDESEMVLAAKAANAHTFISSLRDGYDTWCGEKGMQLSGGQKQRIAIARAILKDPRIILLDEATSALDSQSETAVQSALEKMMVGRTSVVVAHRLSTIRNCDTIAVLEKGKIVEIGNHTSLLGKGPSGAYYSLVNLQSGCNTIY